MSALAARRAELGLVAGSPVSGAARYGARSAGQIGVRERLARVTCPGRNRGLHVVSRSHRAGAGRGPPSREPKWPPETPRDLEALCEAAAQPSPSGLPRAARPALCSRDHTFLQRQQALMLPGTPRLHLSVPASSGNFRPTCSRSFFGQHVQTPERRACGKRQGPSQSPPTYIRLSGSSYLGTGYGTCTVRG